MATLTIADLDNGQRDLQTVDAVANSPADTTITRYGTSVLTLSGALRRLGYKAPVAYASGLNVDTGLFTVSRDGVIYAPDPSLVPFTTGAWNADQWRVIQNTQSTNQVYSYSTRPEAETAAATIPNDSVVYISSDSDYDGRSTENRTSAGAVIFVRLRSNRVDITDFGGKGDGTFVNDDALRAAVAAVDGVGVIYFPLTGGTNYKFVGIDSTDTANVSLDVDSGVKFTVPDAGHLSNSINWYHTVNVDFVNSTGTCTFQHTPASNKRAADRPLWIGMGERDSSRWKAINAATELQYFFFDQRTDGRTPLSVSTSASVFVTSNDDLYLTNFGVRNCSPGETLSFTAEAPSAITVSNAGIVICDDRRYWFWSDGHSSSTLIPKIATKAAGAGVTVQNIVYTGMDTHESYAMFESVVSIRIDGPRRFTVLLNGYAVHVQETPSDIREFGCGMQGLGTLSLRDMNVHKATPMATGRMLSAAVWGDSLTASSMPTTWPKLMVDMLDASNGVRITKLDNYAVPGVDSAHQLALMDSVTLSAYTYHFIQIGTNDIQGQVGVENYINNVNAMITKVLNAGSRVILGVPPMWYTQGQLPGGGGASTNYAKGKFYRSALMRAVGAWDSQRVRLVDLTAVTGPVLSNFRNATLDPALAAQHKDPTVYDTLHLTQNTQILVARAFANALLGDIVDNGFQTLAPSDWSLINTGLNGWTTSNGSRFRRTQDGLVNLSMLVSRATGTGAVNNIVVAQLPRSAWPKSGELIVCAADGTTCTVAVNTSGEVVVYGLASGTYVQILMTYAV